MAGYSGFSMSNNAVNAYNNGEMPLSKWSKKIIIAAIEDLNINLNFDISLLNKLTVKELRYHFLESAGWHHSSKFYNCVDFYKINEDNLAEITNQKIENIIKQRNFSDIVEKMSEEELLKHYNICAEKAGVKIQTELKRNIYFDDNFIKNFIKNNFKY